MKKSKLGTFILSFVPGLGHIYLGFYLRALAFLFAYMGVIAFAGALAILFDDPTPLFLLLLLPVVWLVSMIDSMILVDKVNQRGVQKEEQDGGTSVLLKDQEDFEKQNKKIIAMVLSIIPGVGHMFLGLQRQGIQLMALFFLCFFLTDWLQLGLFIVFVPIIWFFSLFDAMFKASGEEMPQDHDILFIGWFKGKEPMIRNRSKFLAYSLIGIGAYLLVKKVVLPELGEYIDWRIESYIQTGVIALLFIAGGVKLLMGSKAEPYKEEGDMDS